MTVKYDVMVSIRDATTGLEVFGNVLTYSLETDESSGPAQYIEPDAVDASTFVTVTPASISETLELFCATADQEVTWRFNNQSSSGITISPDGIILIVGSTIASGFTTNVRLNNNSDKPATIRVLAVGTDD